MFGGSSEQTTQGIHILRHPVNDIFCFSENSSLSRGVSNCFFEEIVDRNGAFHCDKGLMLFVVRF